MKNGTIWPNKADAANPAIASLFHAGRHWRGVADPGRYCSMRPMRSLSIVVLLCGLGSPIFGGDFYQQFLSAVDTNEFTQPLGALPGLVATNNTGIKLTNALVDLKSLKQSGEISRVRLGMTMQEVVNRWGKPKAGWSRCLHGLITFTYTGVSLGFEGNRLETIHFYAPARLAGGLSSKSQMGEVVRVLGAPTSQAGSADRGSLTYLSAGANLRLEFSDGELAGIYLELTPSRAEEDPLVPLGTMSGSMDMASEQAELLIVLKTNGLLFAGGGSRIWQFDVPLSKFDLAVSILRTNRLVRESIFTLNTNRSIKAR